jgi:hypothetical protein
MIEYKPIWFPKELGEDAGRRETARHEETIRNLGLPGNYLDR